VQTALGSFDKVGQLTVEEVMRLRFPDRSAAQWLTMLQALAAGSWNLDRALLKSGGANLSRILTIGVPDEAKSIFQDGNHDGLISTHDPERIVILLTVYGASFDALKAFCPVGGGLSGAEQPALCTRAAPLPAQQRPDHAHLWPGAGL
jgi:hypothetical protein